MVGAGRDADRHRVGDEIAGLEITPRAVSLADADAPGEDERLGTRPRLHEPALHEELVQAPASRSFHGRIVAQHGQRVIIRDVGRPAAAAKVATRRPRPP